MPNHDLIPSYQKCPSLILLRLARPQTSEILTISEFPTSTRDQWRHRPHPFWQDGKRRGSWGQGQANPHSDTRKRKKKVTKGRELTPGMGSEATHGTPTWKNNRNQLKHFMNWYLEPCWATLPYSTHKKQNQNSNQKPEVLFFLCVFFLYACSFYCQTVITRTPSESVDFQSLLPSLRTRLSLSSRRSITLHSFSHSYSAESLTLSALLQWQGIIYDLRSWILHYADQTSRTTQGGSGPCIPVAHSSRPHQSETVLLLSGACHSVNQWELLLQTLLTNSFWTLLACLQGGRQTDLKPSSERSRSHMFTHLWVAISGRLSPSIAVNQWPSLLQAFTQSDAVSSHSATVTQDGGSHSVSSNHSVASLSSPIRIILSSVRFRFFVHQSESSSLSSPPIRIILSLQSTNQNHPLSPVHQSEPPSLSQQLLAPNVGGLGGEDEGGAVNSCNRPLWSSGHSPLAAHTRHLARTQSARNQHRFHPDRYCWGFRSSQTEASHKLTPYTLALSGHSRLGQRWNCRLMGEHSPSRE